jgi:hypothetical protein
MAVPGRCFLCEQAIPANLFQHRVLDLFFFIPAITMKTIGVKEAERSRSAHKSVSNGRSVGKSFFGVLADPIAHVLTILIHTVWSLGPSITARSGAATSTDLMSSLISALESSPAASANNRSSFPVALLIGVCFHIILPAASGFSGIPDCFKLSEPVQSFESVTKRESTTKDLIYFISLFSWTGHAEPFLIKRRFD